MSTTQSGAASAAVPDGGDVMGGRRTIMATGANMRHIRHAEILQRWPILSEDWAKAIENHRLAAVDHTPGAASFGR